DQVRERGGGGLGVLEFGHRGGYWRALRRLASSAPGLPTAYCRLPTLVRHALRHVEHEVADQVGLFLEPLEVDTVALAVRAPVDVTQVVAGHVLTVLGELVREPLVRRTVQAADEALDDPLRAQPQPLEPR